MIIILFCIAIICPLVGMFCAIANFSKARNAILNAILFGLSCGWGIYGYVCDNGNDIIRHIQNLALYKNKSFFECFDALAVVREVYVWDIWSWFIAKFDDPYLFQVTAAFIGYGILSYLVFDYANIRKFDLGIYVPMLLIGMTMVSPLEVAIGIRFANATMIGILAAYRYYIKNAGKVNTVLLFMTAILLHHSMMVVFVAWLVMPLVKQYKAPAVIITIIILFSFTNYDSYRSLFSNNDSAVFSVLEDSMKSAYIYQFTTASFHSLFRRYLQLIFNVVLIVRCFVTLKRLDYVNGKCKSNFSVKYTYPAYCKRFLDYSEYMFLIGVCMTFLLGTNGNRFLIASSLLGLVPLMETCFINRFLQSNRYLVIDVLLLGCAITCSSLYFYDMNWGTGSLRSFFISLLTGIFSRQFFVI